MKILRNILLPFVPVYFLVTWLRNKFFDLGLLKSKSYTIPIICVGNLSVGGTGKTPMIEYLIKLLHESKHVATLSRGYKRQTNGFIIANENATARTIGDEPFQFYSKFDTIVVSVDANRERGISNLLQLQKKVEVILLDDAYQHRKVQARLNILLTSYGDLYCDDILLPTGNLRESRSGAKRADIIIVTKCPIDLGADKKMEITKKLNILPGQKLYFSSIVYSDTLYSTSDNHPFLFLENQKFTLVTGIANALPLVDYLKTMGLEFEHLNFKDHHDYSSKDVDLLNEKQLILTTEKDFMRLKDKVNNHNIYYLPIETLISNSAELNQIIQKYITD